jgi:hypothetical protein
MLSNLHRDKPAGSKIRRGNWMNNYKASTLILKKLLETKIICSTLKG